MNNPAVKVFDPNRDPSVAGQLKARHEADPSVTGLTALADLGLVETSKGTFWLDTDGYGGIKPLEVRPCEIEFFWARKDQAVTVSGAHGKAVAGGTPVIARFSLADCRGCLTGETKSLHEFLGGRLEQIQKWEAILS
jgi:hypothetical protein